MKPVCLAALLGLLLVTSARAEIYEWVDAGGARHFTNRRDLVPADRRAAVRVVVAASDEVTGEAAASVEEVRPQAVRPAQAEVVVDQAGWKDGYQAGISDGLAMNAGGAARGAGGNVNIVGPLAVANVEESARPAAYGAYSPWPPYYPFVTTSFDRGRSRHLTLRMLLQDQFQLDRDGPFVYERLNPPGLGPNLQPFLPRGLPHHYTSGARVLFR